MLFTNSYPKNNKILLAVLQTYLKHELFIHKKIILTLDLVRASLYSQDPRTVLARFQETILQMNLHQSTLAVNLHSLLSVFAEQCLQHFIKS